MLDFPFPAVSEILQQFGFNDATGKTVPEVIVSLETISQGAATGVYVDDADNAEFALGQGITTGEKPFSLDKPVPNDLGNGLKTHLSGITFLIE